MVAVTFKIHYFTKHGQHVAILGDHEAFGNGNASFARRMTPLEHGNWELEFYFEQSAQPFNYRYVILSQDKWTLFESGPSRVLDLKDVQDFPTLTVVNSWRGPHAPEVSPDVNSGLFTDIIYRRDPAQLAPPANSFASFKTKDDSVTVRFELHCSIVPTHCKMRVCGSIPALGNWVAAHAPAMSDASHPTWSLTLEIPKSQIPFHYKYVFCDASGKDAVWEDEGAKDLYFDQKNKTAAIVHDGSFRRYWNWRGAGVAVPIFALRSTNSLGVGEFLDIKLMADWAQQSGLKLVQILPINDTTVRGNWKDSYPYSSLSVFALHPMYINLSALTTDAGTLKEIGEKQKQLNGLDKIDYEAVVEYKTKTIRALFEKSGGKFLSDPQFSQWFKDNEFWVAPYSLFSVFKDKYKTADYSNWGKHAKITKDEIQTLTGPKSEFYKEVTFYYYVQYNLHVQLKEATQYAATKGVALKGDIAIGVNPKSVDTWVEPRQFRLHKSTGAPPDFFSENGQNWGFPTYNWDEMAKDNYKWWRARLKHMAQYFNAFRIDHILGFFRIWEIPGDCVTGLLGRFYPSIPIWKDELLANGFWDFERLTQPYVRSHLIDRIFGEDAEAVRTKYFDDIGNYSFKFKPEYASEKAIAAALPSEGKSLTPEQLAKNATIREGLFKLIQNVVLLKDDEDPHRFYPRIEMMKTSSWSELDSGFRASLERLYVDYFYRRQEELWAQTGLQRLPVMVNATKMLCCGEDLGMVPRCVEPVMRELRILGLRIQRMPDDPRREFYHPGEYGYLTVCTPSVHDTSTLRGWWEEDFPTSQRFYNRILGEWGEAPRYCDDWLARKINQQHLDSRSMLAVFPLQDLFAMNWKYYNGRNPNDERINIPAIAEHYWRYRMHVNLEDLLADKEFSEQIKQMIRNSGRVH